MFNNRLFIGLAIDEELATAIGKVDSKLYAYFVNSTKEEYLCEVEHSGQKFVGKFFPSPMKLKKLAVLEENVISIIRKILNETDEGLELPQSKLLVLMN